MTDARSVMLACGMFRWSAADPADAIVAARVCLQGRGLLPAINEHDIGPTRTGREVVGPCGRGWRCCSLRLAGAGTAWPCCR